LTCGSSTSGYIVKSREIPQYYYTLIRGLAKATQTAYTNVLEEFFAALKVDDLFPSIPVIVQYVLDRWEAGASPSKASKLINALNKWFQAHLVTYHIGKHHPVQAFIQAHQKEWDKASRIERIPFRIAEIDTISKTVPCKGVALREWKSYVAIAWVFLMRHSEVQGMKPRQLRKYQDNRGIDMWEVYIPGAKTSKSKKDKQYVRFPEDDIPARYTVHLNWLNNQEDDFVWNVGSFKNHVDHIRASLKVLAGSDAEYVFHCTRHGRATWLSEMASYDLEQIQSAGRWKSKSSAYIYMH